jgi:glutathione S-transferase
VAPQDKAYFRESREARFGMSLEAVQADREIRVAEFRASPFPVRLVLGRQAWLGGAAPSYADYIVFGMLQWPRCASRFEVLAAEDPVADWRERMLDLFDGLGSQCEDRVSARQSPIRCSTRSRRCGAARCSNR